MSIKTGDIKLLASERLTDNPDGGGRITGNEIVDGQSNNLFPDISDLDRTYGRVSLRKAFVGIRTNATEVYFGAHLIDQERPADPNVSVTLFSTKSATDERADARDRIESYVVMGPESRMRLLEDQLIGQRSLTVYQDPNAPLPEVGDVYALSTESGEHAGQVQFVRIASVESETRTFNDGQNFQEAVLTLGIGNALRERFYGQAAQRRTDVKPPTRFRQTTVANASQYFASVALAEAGALGDLTLKLDSIYSQLVPSAQSESPLTDVPASGDQQLAIAAGPVRSLSFDFGDGASTRYLDGPIAPGTLYIDKGTGGEVKDDAQGALLKNNAAVGVVDYAKGTITTTAAASLSGTHTVDYQPAAAVAAQTFTQKTDVTLGTRAYTYVANLSPIPQPGTTVVDYRAQNRWYRLRDNGRGELAGELDGTGTGKVDFTTGTVTVTLGALPDVGTAILFFWNIGARYHQRIGEAEFNYTIEHQFYDGDHYAYIDPSSFSISWEADGKTRTATADAGQLSGDATGRITAAGKLAMTPTYVPDVGATFNASYDYYAKASDSIAVNNGTLSGALATTPIKPGSVDFLAIASAAGAWTFADPDDARTWTRVDDMYPSTIDPIDFFVRDDGHGNLVLSTGETVGTVDYSTGAVSGQLASVTHKEQYWCVKPDGFINKYDYRAAVVTYAPPASATATAQYIQDTAAGTNQLAPFDAPPLTIDLTPFTADDVVPTSVQFAFGGHTYIDRDGTLYHDVDPATGAATKAGTVDYVSGVVSIADYAAGEGDFAMRALLTQYAAGVVGAASLRTSGAPLRPGSFFVRADTAKGTLISATADANGDIDNDGIAGHVDAETGVVDLSFAPAVQPSTIFYNAVVYSYLPLDADVLGLDPVRLPQDGRVPIFQPGYVAVVHHTARVAESGLSAGQVLDAGRTRLAAAYIEDAAGKRLDPALYTADLDAGTLTMANSLDLSAYTAPYTFIHRVEDMAIVTDAQVTGYISLQRALSHAFPAGETLVSSALIAGDLQARVTDLFDQKTWRGTFSDDLEGDETSAEYNATAYPIAVTNRGAITERWAIVFTGSTSFKIVGENVGEIALGNTASAAKPTNPNENVPYFTLDPAGWGSGWAAGNVLRFNTVGADFPVWIARTVLQGDATGESDAFRVQIRGNADA